MADIDTHTAKIRLGNRKTRPARRRIEVLTTSNRPSSDLRLNTPDKCFIPSAKPGSVSNKLFGKSFNTHNAISVHLIPKVSNPQASQIVVGFRHRENSRVLCRKEEKRRLLENRTEHRTAIFLLQLVRSSVCPSLRLLLVRAAQFFLLP